MVRQEVLERLVCPRCRGPLESRLSEAVACRSCGQVFPVILDIPDFRMRPMGKREQEVVQALLVQYDRLSFAGLIDYYMTHLSPAYLAEDIRTYYHEYLKDLVERGRRELGRLRGNMRQVGVSYISRRCLDLGCGMGTGAAAAATDFDEVFGIDTSMWRLIVARKFFEGEEVSNVVLVCGYAEALPFQDHFFDLVWAINVIEHLDDRRQALAEVSRTLRPGGCFGADSTNRFSLFTPEPHVGVYWVGFWPRRLASWYVMRCKGMPYLGTRLLSHGELARLLRECFGHRNYWITLRPLEGKRLRRLHPLWYRALRLAIIGTLLKWVAPMYDVVAVRSERG